MYFWNKLNITMHKTLNSNYNDKSMNLKIANFNKFNNVIILLIIIIIKSNNV